MSSDTTLSLAIAQTVDVSQLEDGCWCLTWPNEQFKLNCRASVASEMNQQKLHALSEQVSIAMAKAIEFFENSPGL